MSGMGGGWTFKTDAIHRVSFNMCHYISPWFRHFPSQYLYSAQTSRKVIQSACLKGPYSSKLLYCATDFLPFSCMK